MIKDPGIQEGSHNQEICEIANKKFKKNVEHFYLIACFSANIVLTGLFCK